MNTAQDTNKKINKAVRLLKEASHSEVSNVQDKLTNTYMNTKMKVTETASELSDKVKKNAELVDNKVKKNPWTFIGAAALVGSSVGFFAGRRK